MQQNKLIVEFIDMMVSVKFSYSIAKCKSRCLS